MSNLKTTLNLAALGLLALALPIRRLGRRHQRLDGAPRLLQ